MSKLKPHALATKLAKSSGEAYRTIPSVYLICEEDNGIPPEAQEGMVKAAQDAGADLKAERLKSSHSPFLSRPEETADFLLRAAS